MDVLSVAEAKPKLGLVVVGNVWTDGWHDLLQQCQRLVGRDVHKDGQHDLLQQRERFIGWKSHYDGQYDLLLQREWIIGWVIDEDGQHDILQQRERFIARYGNHDGQMVSPWRTAASSNIRPTRFTGSSRSRSRCHRIMPNA